MTEKLSNMISQEVYAALKEYGLTDYETRAFIALITNGISSAKELSERTKIPYSRIYDVLVNLENIGWVSVISGRPMKYRAERPKNVARLAKKQIEAKFERIEFVLLEKLEPLYEDQKTVDSSPIWIINGNIVDRMCEHIINSKEEINICMKTINEELLEEMFNSLLKANENKVNIRLLIPQNDLEIKNKNIWRKLGTIAEVKTDINLQFDCFILDNSELVVFLTSFFKIILQSENLLFLVQDESLINRSKDYFKAIWQKGNSFTLKDID